MTRQYHQLPRSLTPSSLRHRRGEGGFTLVEMMVSMVILALGVTSILALQTASLEANSIAQEVTTGNALARNTLEMLRLDASRWTTTLIATKYFNQSVQYPMSNTTNNWIPYTNQPVNFQSADISATRSAGVKAEYCIFYRYSWAGDDAALPSRPLQDEMLRVDVAVVWLKNPRSPPALFANCGANPLNFANILIFINNSLIVRQFRASSYLRRNMSGVI